MPTPHLLISVRNADEALAALQGDADLVDIKDPGAGPLGMADCATMQTVLRAVNHARPVSAAMGELRSAPHASAIPASLDYVKIGLAGATDWHNALTVCAHAHGLQRFIPVAYADHARVAAPPVDEVLEWAVANQVAGILVDTAVKDGRGLLQVSHMATVRGWIERAHKAGLTIALAGALGRDAITQLAPLQPDIIAVRSAVCARGQRTATIDAARVAQIKHLLATHTAAARHSSANPRPQHTAIPSPRMETPHRPAPPAPRKRASSHTRSAMST